MDRVEAGTPIKYFLSYRGAKGSGFMVNFEDAERGSTPCVTFCVHWFVR